MSKTTKLILILVIAAIVYWWYKKRQSATDVPTDNAQSTTKAASFDGGGGFGGGAYASPANDLNAAIANAPVADNTYQGLFNGQYALNQMLPNLQQMASTPSTVIQGATNVNSSGLSYHTAPQAPASPVSISTVPSIKTIKATGPISYNPTEQA